MHRVLSGHVNVLQFGNVIFTLSGHTKILLVVNIVYGLQQNEGGILPQRQAVSHGSEVLRSPHPCPPVIICLTHIVFYNPIS